MTQLKVFAITLAVFLILDAIWLGFLMKGFYNSELGNLARRNGPSLAPRWTAAILVYLLIPAGLFIFVKPLLSDSSPTWNAAAWGAVYGIVVYGVYDLTNLAVIEKWTVKMTVIDMLWGASICAMSSTVMKIADRWTTS